MVWFFYQFRVSNSGFCGPFWSLWFIKRMGNWGTKSSFLPIKQINLRNCKNVEGVPNSIIIIFCYPLWFLCGPFSFFMNWVGSWDHKLSLLLIKPALKPFISMKHVGNWVWQSVILKPKEIWQKEKKKERQTVMSAHLYVPLAQKYLAIAAL